MVATAVAYELVEHVKQDDIKQVDSKYGFGNVDCVSPVQSAQLEVGHIVQKGEVGLNIETNNA